MPCPGAAGATAARDPVYQGSNHWSLDHGVNDKDLNGKPSFCMMSYEILTLSLALQIRWQVRYFRRLATLMFLLMSRPYAVGKDFAGRGRRCRTV